MRNRFDTNRYDKVPVPKLPNRNPYSCGSELILDCEFGRWIPAGSYFAIPGDKIKVGQNAFIRTIPLVTVPFTGFHVKFVTFFTSLRNLDDDADKIITGFDEDENPFIGSFDTWKVSTDTDLAKWSNYDYMSFQNVSKSVYDAIPDKCKPADYWRKNLYFIYNEWLREPKLQNAIDEDTNNDPIPANYGRDRYTAASLQPQLGDEATIPLESTNSVSFGDIDDLTLDDLNLTNLYDIDSQHQGTSALHIPRYTGNAILNGVKRNYNQGATTGVESLVGFHNGNMTSQENLNDDNFGFTGIHFDDDWKQEFKDWLDANTVSINGGFGVNDTRLAFAKQLIAERMNTVGSRYNEFLRSNYGLAPADETLQRPVFIGSSQAPILVDEVTNQTAGGLSPLGDIGGKGVSMNTSYTKSYTCKEFGVVQTLMCIVPDVYYSQGIPKQFTYKSKNDFFNPLYQCVGEQEVLNSELFVNGTSGVDGDDDAWGFDMLYEELKVPERRICGSFRDYLDSYTLARKFATRPHLNGDFVKCDPSRDNLNRIFVAIDSTKYKQFHVHLYNDVRALRPLIRYPIAASLKGM